MTQETPRQPEVTLLVCTFNRSADLRGMLRTAVAQVTDGSFDYEVLVIDNNSTDDTKAVVNSFVEAGHGNVRYLFEPRQGKSHALNTGLAAARGRIYTIADDDFILPESWVQKIVDGFRTYPEASFVSGKVLPLWEGEVPAWLRPDLWSALALADYGNEPFSSDGNRQVCLLACSFRRDHVEAAGGYNPALGVTKNLIGGVEDLEILQRLWKAGRRGVYLPHISFLHKVPANRLTKAYQRRWHTGHGRFYARLRDGEYERSTARLFDVPSHVYGQALRAALGWVRHAARGRTADAFVCETRVRFCLGFFRQRRRDYKRRGGGSLREITSILRALVARVRPRDV